MGDEESKAIARAKNRAYRLLTFRPRSRSELAAKLLEKDFDDAVVEAVLADLARLGYINDRQFAEQWASGRIRLRGFGRRRIEQELRNKGIDREIVGEALGQAFGADTEAETAHKEAEKKLNIMKSADRETRRRRLAGFLERKGFSYDVIRIVLKDTDCI